MKIINSVIQERVETLAAEIVAFSFGRLSKDDMARELLRQFNASATSIQYLYLMQAMSAIEDAIKTRVSSRR